MPITTKLLLALLGALALSASLPVESAETAPATDYDAMAKSAIETVARMIEADTTNLPGNEARVARIVAKRLDKAGIDYEITEFAPGRENIVARLKATEPQPGKPLMLLAHEDVVTAEGQKWSTDPHKLTERDGYLYGRGIADDLGMAAVNLEVFIELKKSGARLKRDVILAMTGDEESGGLGIQYQLKHKPESLDAEITLNEGGHVILDQDGKAKLLDLSAAEKTYRDFELVAQGKTGHSSVPVKDNAIYRLARALARLEANPPTERLLPVTRAYLKGRSAIEKPPLSKAMLELARSPEKGKLPAKALKIVEEDPQLAAILRTTCVATILKAGTRVNALPANATANVNCRILPDESVEQTKAWLEKVIADPGIQVTGVGDFGYGPASPIEGKAAQAIEKITHQMWPELPIIPSLMRGASDSRYIRREGSAAYGINPLPIGDEDALRMHGIDERVPKAAFRSGVEYLHRLALEIAGG